MMGFGGFAQSQMGKPFHPSQIPQLAAGEYWLPGLGVSGTNPVNWAGQNATNTLSAAAVQAPDAVTGPGGFPAWQFVAANSDVWTRSSPSGPLTATDGVYVAIDFFFSPLDTTNRVIAEQYGLAGERRWHIRKTASLAILQVEWSDDGTNVLTSTVELTEAENVGNVSQLDKYLFLELLIDPSGGTLAAKTRMWLNMREVTWGSQSGTGGASLFNGGTLRLGNNNFENQDFAGQLGRFFVGRKTNGVLLPTLVQRRALMHYRSPKQRAFQVVVDGNSLTAGQGASVPFVTSYPGVLRSALVSRGIPARDVHDRGFGGQKTSDMIAGFPTRVLPFYDPVFLKNIYVFFEVRNSSITGLTAAQIYQEHVTLAQMAQQAGFFVVVCTAPGSDGEPAGVGKAGAVNAMIRSGWPTFAHAFVDLEVLPVFTPSGSLLNPTYYSDGVHLSDAGYAAVAQAVLDVIA